MTARPVQLELLAQAGRLLLEYNESTGEIHRTLADTARALNEESLDAAVLYSGVTVTLCNGESLRGPVHEIRYNAALQARVHAILDQTRRRELEPAAALDLLNRVEQTTPRHPAWQVALLLAAGAAAFALLLGADAAAVAVVALSTAAGLYARQELHRQRFSLLTLPLVAAFLGAALGGLAIRFGWTQSPGLAVIVPALMVVPGPHLLNGLFDLIDNRIPMSVARLTLGAGILAAAALGVILGVALMLSLAPGPNPFVAAGRPNLLGDMLLAAVATVSFAAYYNSTWRQIALAAVGGALGHGARYLALGAGWSLPVSTFAGGLVVGVIAALIARSAKTPVALIAFSGAVTMMPGLQIYSALRGAMHIVRLPSASDPATINDMLASALEAAATVVALGVGLVIAIRTVNFLFRTRDDRQSL